MIRFWILWFYSVENAFLYHLFNVIVPFLTNIVHFYPLTAYTQFWSGSPFRPVWYDGKVGRFRIQRKTTSAPALPTGTD